MPPPLEVRNFNTNQNVLQQLQQDINTNMTNGVPWAYLVTAATGVGKTTNIPLLLAKFGRVIVIQYRRYPTFTIFGYMRRTFRGGVFGPWIALKMGKGVTMGNIRDSVLTFMTDGFLQKYASTGNLEAGMLGGTILVLDEVHSPSLPMELLFQQLSEIISRQDRALQVLCMSATMNIPRFHQIFPNSNVYTVAGGPRYTINTVFCNLSGTRPALITNILEGIIRGNYPLPPGIHAKTRGVLIIVAGKDTGRECLLRFQRKFPMQRDKVWFIHSEVPMGDIEDVAGLEEEKYIFSTEVSESGISFDAVSYVIECMVRKKMVMDDYLGEDSLIQVPVTAEVVDQSKGRAGRTATGVFLPVATQFTLANLEPYALSATVLGSHLDWVFGIIQLHPSLYPLPWAMNGIYVTLEHPEPKYVHHAVKMLKLVGAVTDAPTPACPIGVHLTDLGGVANNLRLSRRSSIFWAQSDPADSPAMRALMGEFAIVLHFHEANLKVMGENPTEEERARKRGGQNRPPVSAIQSLGIPGFKVECWGDVMADWVELFHSCGRTRRVDSFYRVNPRFRQEQRLEVDAFWLDLINQDIPLSARPTNSAAEISYRFLKAYPDKLVKVTQIEYNHAAVTSVRARKVCNNASVNFEWDTAFDFEPFITATLQQEPSGIIKGHVINREA